MTFSRRLTLKKGNAGRPFSNRRPQNQIFRKFRALLAGIQLEYPLGRAEISRLQFEILFLAAPDAANNRSHGHTHSALAEHMTMLKRHGGLIKHQRYTEGVEHFFVIAVPLEACVQNLALLGICALFLGFLPRNASRRRVHRREWRRRQRGGLPYHGDRPVQNELPAREKAAFDEAHPPDSGLKELTLPLSIRKKVPLPFA
jgi:hypothetical protein